MPIKNFRFWCQSVLPLVYDDSLSYYELLNKVVKYLNDVINQTNTFGEQLSNLTELYNELSKKLDDFYESEEFVDKVEESLDKMVNDGTLSSLLNSSLINKPTLIKNSNGGVTKVLDTAGTYIARDDDFIYGNFNGAYNTNCVLVDGKHVIDCSTFVQLAVTGVTFENSRYNGHIQNIQNPSFFIPQDSMIISPTADRPYGMLASDFAKWCYNYGYYFESDDVQEISAGDVLFAQTTTPTSQQWKGITHCALVTGVRNGYVLVVEAGTVTEPTFRSNAYALGGSEIIGFARLPYADNNTEPFDTLINKYNIQEYAKAYDVVIPAGSRLANLVYVNVENPLTLGKTYTLFVESDDFLGNEEIFFTGNSGGTYVAFPSVKGINVLYRTFVYGDSGEIIPFGPNDIGAYSYLVSIRIPAQASVFEKTYNVKRIALLEGAFQNPSGIDTEPAKDTYRLKIASQIETVSSTQELNTLVNSIVNIGPSQQFKEHLIFVSSDTSVVKRGYYWLLTYLVGGSLNVGRQLLIGVNSKRIYSRFSTNRNWNEFTDIASDKVKNINTNQATLTLTTGSGSLGNTNVYYHENEDDTVTSIDGFFILNGVSSAIASNYRVLTDIPFNSGISVKRCCGVVRGGESGSDLSNVNSISHLNPVVNIVNTNGYCEFVIPIQDAYNIISVNASLI